MADGNIWLSLISAGSALIGSAIGVLGSGYFGMLHKKKDWELQMKARELQRREQLYCDFTNEYGRLKMLAIIHSGDSPLTIKQFSDAAAALESLMAQIRIVSSERVAHAAYQMHDHCIDAHRHNDLGRSIEDSPDEEMTIWKFSKICREELSEIQRR